MVSFPHITVVRTRQALQQAENNATDTSLAQEAAEQSQQQLQSQLSFFDEVNITSNQSGQKPRKSSSSKSGVRKMTTTQRQKLEKQREEQVQDMWSSLRLQGELVFSDDWWHRDVILDGELTEEEEMRAREALASREDFSQPEDEEEQASLDRAKRIVATREWMETAHTLVEGFRGTRALFPRDRTSKFKGVVRTFRKRKRKDLDSQATELMSRIQDRMCKCLFCLDLLCSCYLNWFFFFSRSCRQRSRRRSGRGGRSSQQRAYFVQKS